MTVSKMFTSKEGCSKLAESFKEAFGKKKKVRRLLTTDGDDLKEYMAKQKV